MSKANIMRLANQLMSALETCYDGNFVDEVCANIASNVPFDEDKIAAAEEGDDPEW